MMSGRGPLSSNDWNIIITKFYNSKENEEELKKWLTDMVIKQKSLCENDNSISNKFDCEREN